MSMNLLFSRGYSKSESTERAVECCYSNTKSTQLLPAQQCAALENAG
jgi:hypothetical protein